MSSTATPPTGAHFAPGRTVSFDEALEHVNRAEILATEVDRLHRTDPGDRAGIGYANQHLGIELKLAQVHASLAGAEATHRLLEALAPFLAPAVPAPALRMDADAPLAVVRDLVEAPSAAVHARLCSFITVDDDEEVTPCGEEAVVFPPALCAAHGGLEVTS